MSCNQLYKRSKDFLHCSDAYRAISTENFTLNNLPLQSENMPIPRKNMPPLPKNMSPLFTTEYKSQSTAENNTEDKLNENVKPLKNTNLQYVQINDTNSSNPEVWGPAFWFSLHNGALRYPNNASPHWKERMKNFILGIPVMLPCQKCMMHATAYIDDKKQELDEIVNDKEKLFDFFCCFHNFVNKRLEKSELSTKDAYKLYSANTNLTKLKLE